MGTKICKIVGCSKPLYVRGWCRSHYVRFMTHGDALKGRTPRGDVTKFYLEKVLTYKGNDCFAWPYTRNLKGYATMKVKGVSKLVSRLACEEEHGPPPTPEHHAAHSCGNGHLACVTLAHLGWKTPIANEADKLRHGTRLRGESHGASKITEADARTILSLKGKNTQREIAEGMGISQQQVCRIQSRKRWAWL